MCSGVGKSGSPAPKPMTSSPAAFSALALASTASVADSVIAAMRAEMRSTRPWWHGGGAAEPENSERCGAYPGPLDDPPGDVRACAPSLLLAVARRLCSRRTAGGVRRVRSRPGAAAKGVHRRRRARAPCCGRPRARRAPARQHVKIMTALTAVERLPAGRAGEREPARRVAAREPDQHAGGSAVAARTTRSRRC